MITIKSEEKYEGFGERDILANAFLNVRSGAGVIPTFSPNVIRLIGAYDATVEDVASTVRYIKENPSDDPYEEVFTYSHMFYDASLDEIVAGMISKQIRTCVITGTYSNIVIDAVITTPYTDAKKVSDFYISGKQLIQISDSDGKLVSESEPTRILYNAEEIKRMYPEMSFHASYRRLVKRVNLNAANTMSTIASLLHVNEFDVTKIAENIRNFKDTSNVEN